MRHSDFILYVGSLKWHNIAARARLVSESFAVSSGSEQTFEQDLNFLWKIFFFSFLTFANIYDDFDNQIYFPTFDLMSQL